MSHKDEFRIICNYTMYEIYTLSTRAYLAEVLYLMNFALHASYQHNPIKITPRKSEYVPS